MSQKCQNRKRGGRADKDSPAHANLEVTEASVESAYTSVIQVLPGCASQEIVWQDGGFSDDLPLRLMRWELC